MLMGISDESRRSHAQGMPIGRSSRTARDPIRYPAGRGQGCAWALGAGQGDASILGSQAQSWHGNRSSSRVPPPDRTVINGRGRRERGHAEKPDEHASPCQSAARMLRGGDHDESIHPQAGRAHHRPPPGRGSWFRMRNWRRPRSPAIGSSSCNATRHPGPTTGNPSRSSVLPAGAFRAWRCATTTGCCSWSVRGRRREFRHRSRSGRHVRSGGRSVIRARERPPGGERCPDHG